MRTAHLQLIADVQHGLAGSDNIIGNEDVLTLDILAQVFMGNNGVAAIHNAAPNLFVRRFFHYDSHGTT